MYSNYVMTVASLYTVHQDRNPNSETLFSVPERNKTETTTTKSKP